ncbi:uncharacterized protein KY384_005344 [Bacidia gigantensis]|uniref:uncharacterized protein n=1 Tax=Bacidia gigantensis TaxID=2732470 RepID=UPI001D05B83F|nr:uncharacterized protein KY384_005344 [Bacidia gigantensis]KAG8529863.1 hypothetical protein KY384_005344 [Bacidia gigantensis]
MATTEGPTAVEPPPRITETTLLVHCYMGALWSLRRIFAARIGVRLGISRKLYWDDALATGALLALLGLCIALTLAVPGMYAVLQVGSGLRKPTATFLDDASRYLKLQFALSILYWTCLCYPLACSSFVLGECENSKNLYRSQVSLKYSTAVDIISDAFIIALPMYLALRVQLPWSQKIALGAVFSIGAVIMVFSGIRIAVNMESGKHPEVSWLNLWSQIEASIAVIISSIAPFKAFFTQRRMKSSYEEGNSPSKRYPPTSWNSGHLRGTSSRPPAAIPLEDRSSQFALQHHHGTINIAPKEDDPTERIFQKREAGVGSAF